MNDFTLFEQRAIVTGGTRGIGRGICEEFLRAGAATVIATWGQNEAAAKKFYHETIKMIEEEKLPGTLQIAKCNVCNESEVKMFYEEVTSSHPSIEILVNNAGIRRDSLAATMSLEHWQSVLDTNLTGTFLMSKYAVLHFLSNRYGRIINIGSIGGDLGLPGQTNYSSTKAALVGFSKSLAKEVARKNITVNVVEPGFIETELLSDLSPEQKESYQKEVPLRRFGKVSEVAFAVLALAHRRSSYITGSCLRVSGGL
ncbi:MAG: 3-oxoacyl-ACP reductase FabG [Oligoflexia bacterium]|nr:3-oxoacyl-ACP reductase FabG [Oligoflexia bacterium]MBF0366832.1 3-oxoacyl-ACP reductase FabG [Oligoflexia bacterium]